MTETLTPILPDDIEQLAHRLLQRACDREIMLATAESCTGGLLGSVMTDVEGASHAFDRGFIVYTDEAKQALLDVPTDMLAREGAVSRPVAIAMAEGAIARSDAGVAVAITGFAGRGGNGSEPGLVHFACALREGATRHREEHFGDIGRGPTRIACLRTALEMLGEALS